MIYGKLNRLIFTILSQLFFLVVYGQYIPGSRVGSRAVLVNNKIYYIGGVNKKGFVSLDEHSDVFYYDNEAPSSTTSLQPWVDLGSQVIIPLISWHSISLGGANQDSIFIIGGAVFEEDKTSLVYQIDTKTNVVGPPEIQGKIPPRRRDINSVVYEGKIYLFSGRKYANGFDTFFNNFDILNTITMTWEVGSLVNAPTPRFSYTATLVNGVIYYIGGARQQGQTNIFEQMSNIYLYDIASSTWSLKTATAAGPLPQGRTCHTAAYYNRTIYIYGGETETLAAAQETMVLLDTTTLQWSIPPQLENTNTPRIDHIPKLFCHTATLIDNKHMFLAFGNLTDNTANPIHISNDYYYSFNLENLQWFRLTIPDPPSNSINPPNPPPTFTSPTVSTAVSIIIQPLNTKVIIGLSAGLSVVGLGALAAFIFIYKHIKRKNQDEELNNDVGIPSESMKINHTEINDVGIPSESMKINQRSSTYNQTNHTEVNDVGIPSESMKINQRSSTYNQTNHTEVNDVGIPSESMKINQRSSTYSQTNHTEVKSKGWNRFWT